MAFKEEDFDLAFKESDCPDLNGWEFVVKSHGVSIYRLYRAQSKLYEYKVEGVVDIKAQLCAAVYMDIAYRRTWDSYVKELTYIHKGDAEIIYWEVAYPWPMSNRDYVYLRQLGKRTKNGQPVWIILGRSANRNELEERQTVDEKKGVIRVDDYHQSMVITDDGNNASRVYMHYYDNPKGMIPSMIVNWAAKTGVPGFLSDLENACKKYQQPLQI